MNEIATTGSRPRRAARSVLVLVLAGCAACASDPPPGKGDAGSAGSSATAGGAAGETAGSGAGDTAGSAGGNADHSGSGGTSGGSEPAGGMSLSDLGEPLMAGDPGPSDVQLAVHAGRAQRPIDAHIYGVNGAAELATTRPTVVRSGGNRLTAYNWENNASNAGKDYMFQNDGYLDQSDEPGKVALDVIETAASGGAAAIVTVPIVDYVAADKNGGGDVRGSGDDYLQTRFRKNLPRKGGALAAVPDADDDSVYQDEFVQFVEQHAPDGAEVLFSLDNEPDLWASTHAEVHPDPVTYDELWTRSKDYAGAIVPALLTDAWVGVERSGHARS